MKKFFLTFLIFFLSSKVSLACDITFVNFGDKSDKLMENPGSLPFEDEFKGKKILIPTSYICPNNEKLNDTMVEYLFVDDKLVLIILTRAFMNDNALMDFAMNKYGKFKLPIGVDKKNWRGSHTWEVGNNIILYVHANTEEGPAELLEISSKLYSQELYNYNDKVSEWLDSQQQ